MTAPRPAATWLGFKRYGSSEFASSTGEVEVSDWNGPARGVRRICLRRLADSRLLTAEPGEQPGAFYVYHPDHPDAGEWVHTRDPQISPRCHCWDMLDRGDDAQDPNYGGVPCKHLLAALRADGYRPLAELEAKLQRRDAIALALAAPVSDPE